jgi:hypothetical protein
MSYRNSKIQFRVHSNPILLFRSLIVFSLLFLLSGQNSQAGLWDKVNGKMNQCGSWLNSTINGAAKAVDQTAREIAESAELKKKFDDALTKVGTVAGQINEAICVGTDCTTKFVFTFTTSIPGAIVRVVRFDSSLAAIKEQVLLPSLGLLQIFKEAKVAGDSKTMAWASAKITVLALESEPKFIKIIGTQATNVVSTAGGVVTSLVVPASGPNLPKEIAVIIRDTLIEKFKKIFWGGDKVNLNEMVEAEQLGATMVQKIIAKLKEYSVNLDFDAEVAKWVEENRPQ